MVARSGEYFGASGSWISAAAGERAVARRPPTEPHRASAARSERALRWRDEDPRARGVVLGCAVRVLCGRGGCAAPPLLRASRRGLARLPRSRRLRGARAVAGRRRRHRAGPPRVARPRPLAARGRRRPPQAAARGPRVLGTIRSALEEQTELYRVRGEAGPHGRRARPAAEEDREVAQEDPGGLQVWIQWVPSDTAPYVERPTTWNVAPYARGRPLDPRPAVVLIRSPASMWSLHA